MIRITVYCSVVDLDQENDGLSGKGRDDNLHSPLRHLNEDECGDGTR